MVRPRGAPVKTTLVTLFQSRMDKCTTEQFWAVATLTGMDGAVLLQRHDIQGVAPAALLALLVAAANLYAVALVVSRHLIYCFYRRELAALLRDEPEVPRCLTRPLSPWSPSSLSGVVFYGGWIAALGAIATLALLG